MTRCRNIGCNDQRDGRCTANVKWCGARIWPPVQSDIPCECGTGYNPECQAHYPPSDQSDTDRHEKSESRAGIPPFESGEERRPVDVIL
jgi:hypothetical protein